MPLPAVNNKQVIQPHLQTRWRRMMQRRPISASNNLSLRVACGLADKECYSEVLQEYKKKKKKNHYLEFIIQWSEKHPAGERDMILYTLKESCSLVFLILRKVSNQSSTAKTGANNDWPCHWTRNRKGHRVLPSLQWKYPSVYFLGSGASVIGTEQHESQGTGRASECFSGALF